jgi:hypothetical protein
MKKERLILFGSLLLGIWGVMMITTIFFNENQIDLLFWPMVLMPIISAAVFIMAEFYLRESKEQNQ